MEQKGNRVFTAILSQNVAAGGNAVNIMTVDISNRTARLKSISLDVYMRTVAGVILPMEQNNTQQFNLQVDAVPQASPFAQIVSNFAGTSLLTNNGNRINIRRPNQLKFDSFFIRSNLLLSFNYMNNDVLNAYIFEATIIVELEDIEVIP